MDTRDLVAVLWLLIPQKSKAPYFANMAKPLADALKEDYYAKCRQVLGWSSKDLEHCEEIINYFFTNNKDYFNDV
jgi:hypothetical protein